MTRRELLLVLRSALRQMHLGERVLSALAGVPLDRATVIAIGKAAPAMVSHVNAKHILVVTTDGTEAPKGMHVVRAGHPVPDARSVRAAERCLAMAGSRSADIVVVLVSGGASALVCAPSEGIRFAEKRALTKAMLASGASIQELNVVRKHLSRIKGGGLARAAAPVPVLTLVVSDVIGGSPSDVGSGPSVQDESSVSEARALLRRYAPGFVDLPLVQAAPVSNAAGTVFIASPEELARVAASELRARGYHVRLLRPSQARVNGLARRYAELAKTLGRRSAIVRIAEPSVEIPPESRGRGGRSTRLATYVARALPAGVTFLAAATDGVDGISGTAGAIVDGTFARRIGERAIAKALAEFDTGPLQLRAGTAIPMHPTGHNLADLHVLVRS